MTSATNLGREKRFTVHMVEPVIPGSVDTLWLNSCWMLQSDKALMWSGPYSQREGRPFAI